TELCTKIERDFLSCLHGGCSTPISGLAEIKEYEVIFKGNIVSTDGEQKVAISKTKPIAEAIELGYIAAKEILSQGGQSIVDSIRKKGLITDA
ncbi:MAG: hydroxymethylbilane synthase, partial [Flavisolibacter sp.]